MYRNKKIRLILPIIGVILIAVLVNLVFVEKIFSEPIVPMPPDQNRENNFRANGLAWMVEDRLHLSYRNKTLQVGDSGRFRRMNGKETVATVTDDYYLYGYLDPDNGIFLDLRLVRRSDGVQVFRSKKSSDAYLGSTHLYYVEPPYGTHTLKRYSLADGTVEEVLPYVSTYRIVGNHMLYTTGGEVAELDDYESRNNPSIRYHNLQTGEDFVVSQYEYPIGVGALYVDDCKIYFRYRRAIYCFDPDSQVLSVFINDPDISLRNAFNGKLYFDRVTEADDGRYTHELFSLDIATGEQTDLLTKSRLYNSSPIDITILDKDTFLFGMWDSGYIINRDGKNYVLM